MNNALLIIQLVAVALLILIILLQKPSSDTITSIGPSSNPGANLQPKSISGVAKITWLLVTIFFGNSILIARSSYQESHVSKQIIESISSDYQEDEGANELAPESAAATNLPQPQKSKGVSTEDHGGAKNLANSSTSTTSATAPATKSQALASADSAAATKTSLSHPKRDKNQDRNRNNGKGKEKGKGKTSEEKEAKRAQDHKAAAPATHTHNGGIISQDGAGGTADQTPKAQIAGGTQ